MVTASSLGASGRHLYDTIGRETQTYDGVNGTPIKSGYNALFQTSTRDQKGQYYKTDVNALGWPTVVYDPADTTTWSKKQVYHYDLAGNVTSYENQRGEWVTMQYDKFGRLTSRRDTTGTADSLWYASNGKIIVASNGVEVDSIRLGVAGADTVVTHVGGHWYKRVHSATEGTTADTTVLTSSISGLVLANRMRFWNQSKGILDSLKVGSHVFKFRYDGNLALDTLQMPSSFTRYDTRTTTGSVYARDYSGIFDTVFTRRYVYDSLGRIASEQRVDGSSGGIPRWELRSFAYAGTGALRRYALAQTTTQTCLPSYGCNNGTPTDSLIYGYQYDAVNNLTAEVDTSAFNTTTSGTYATGNRLTAWGSASFTYDADGNRITNSGVETYTWSAMGQLQKVVEGSDSVEYAYNALGQLARVCPERS